MKNNRTKISAKVENGILITLCITLFFLISSCSFSSKITQRLFDEAKTKSYDIIIVPGVPFENGQWSQIMQIRVYWSKYLFDKGIAKNIMYSGSSVYSPYVEAEIMALYGAALGIPEKNIFTETKAEHSTENVYYSYHKARKLGFEKIALASDPFQTKMLRKFSRKRVSPDIAMIPIVYDTLKAMEPSMINPKIDYQRAFVKDFISITERESFWKRLKGTRGKNIDYNSGK